MTFIADRRMLLRAACASLAAASMGAAIAQSENAGKPLRMIVPLAAGSTVDAVARALAPSFGHTTGHPVVVENLVGAGGLPGTT